MKVLWNFALEQRKLDSADLVGQRCCENQPFHGPEAACMKSAVTNGT